MVLVRCPQCLCKNYIDDKHTSITNRFQCTRCTTIYKYEPPPQVPYMLVQRALRPNEVLVLCPSCKRSNEVKQDLVSKSRDMLCGFRDCSQSLIIRPQKKNVSVHQVKCPHCQRVNGLRSDQFGIPMRCGVCGGTFKFGNKPGTATGEDNARSSGDKSLYPSVPPPDAPQSSQSKEPIQVRCPGCMAVNGILREHLGVPCRCAKCSFVFVYGTKEQAGNAPTPAAPTAPSAPSAPEDVGNAALRKGGSFVANVKSDAVSPDQLSLEMEQLSTAGVAPAVAANAAARKAADGLTDAEVSKYTNIFEGLDTDKNGLLSVEELRSGLKKAGWSHSVEEVQEMLREADEDGSGGISLPEFLRFMEKNKVAMAGQALNGKSTTDVALSAFEVQRKERQQQMMRRMTLTSVLQEMEKEQEQDAPAALPDTIASHAHDFDASRPISFEDEGKDNSERGNGSWMVWRMDSFLDNSDDDGKKKKKKWIF